MIDKILELSIEEMKNGYSFNSIQDRYVCNICGREFEKGEIFEVDGRYFEAGKMIKIHMENEHSNMLEILTGNDKKYTGLTENQRELLKMIHSGMSDSEIAKKTGVAPATIRHQRFVFKEKAKQAKLFLAIYEAAMQKQEINKSEQGSKDELVNIHSGAKMIDDRYFITKAEEEQILSTMFEAMSPLKLKTFSSKEKKKIVILRRISQEFTQGRRYTEKELNSILKDIYEDYATIRRYLIEYGFMDRTNDCKEYWLK